MILTDTPSRLSPAELGAIARRIAASPERWANLIRFDPWQRWYQRFAADDRHEVWLLSWLPGQDTGFHDHGGSAGAFAVARGSLRERIAPGRRPGPFGAALEPGTVRSFGPRYLHDVRNDSARAAVSVHVYSPPLAGMRRYRLTAGGLLRPEAADRQRSSRGTPPW